MKRITLTALTFAAVCAFSGVAASSSLAACYPAFPAATGNYSDSQCVNEVANGAYVKVLALKTRVAGNIWCAEVEPNKGSYTNSQCTAVGTGNFRLVIVPGPHWRVNGTQLKQGLKQIKLQSKGSLVLKSPTLAEVECKNSISEGATIEGNGNNQGQGKGRVSYSSCKVLKPEKPECTVAEPIVTNQLKSYLAYANTQTKIVNVFEPTEGTLFVELKFSVGCGAALEGPRGVNGKIAAEVIPSETEGQEGLIAFPSEAINVVEHEGEEVKLSLKAIGVVSKFSGAYGARLATVEPFGVFASAL